MESIVKSLDLLNSIQDYSNSKEVLEISRLSFELCPLCMEAAAIYARMLDDEEKKFDFLFDAVFFCKEYVENEKIEDELVIKSLHRGFYELGCMCLEYGKYDLAQEVFEELETSGDLMFNSSFMIYLLKINKGENVDEYFNQHHDDLKVMLGYAINLYRQNRYEELKKLMVNIDKKNHSLSMIINEELVEGDKENEETKEALKALRSCGFLINMNPYLIKYLRGNK